MLISQCCDAPLKTASDDEGTYWYSCSKCFLETQGKVSSFGTKQSTEKIFREKNDRRKIIVRPSGSANL